jgi:hypothetical protein
MLGLQVGEGLGKTLDGFASEGYDVLAQAGEGIYPAHKGLLEALRVERGKDAPIRIMGRNALVQVEQGHEPLPLACSQWTIPAKFCAPQIVAGIMMVRVVVQCEQSHRMLATWVIDSGENSKLLVDCPDFPPHSARQHTKGRDLRFSPLSMRESWPSQCTSPSMAVVRGLTKR